MQPVLVTAAILWQNSRILLAQRPQHDRMAGLWEFPGGKIEAGETPQNCLQRELLEELGIETQIGNLFMETDYHYPHIYIRLLAFHAIPVKGQLVLHNHAAIAWVLPHELLQYPLAPADVPIATRLAHETTT
ncbi:(deoxy)nucleoside triphosphate pyrophosphohydrolase [Sphingobacteriales bacterium UPWRP_1]|nr:hypothetical protein BVG80_05260 [Sphingobacteriales bacterium TSM_CSM]PSJ73769.1 (deoxy)nucleoside triphosphate pyrophosphohydrolase [Sphingobacteriales bacterium UPWRP_1]